MTSRPLLSLLALAAPLVAQPGATATGIDVLVATDFAALRGRRIGLITNHTGIAADGRATVDLLLAADGVRVTALFSPEHGFHGVLDAKVADAVHGRSGLPIHSLYGDHRQPSAAQLAAVDDLVFDVQDIGCRFYTYISTMGLAMAAAAEHGKGFVVLDRPNPIGGTLVEGPVLDAGRESFVGFHALPVRHGMTVGELARMFAAERGGEILPTVIEMRGWDRRQPYDATGLTWVDPSPNMRSLAEAYLYPAVGLLEFTNLSVGRGTNTPFEVVGAPWLDGRRLARELHDQDLPGVTFVPVRFTPDASKFAGEGCGGINIAITDRAAYRAMPLALALASTLRRLYPDDWQLAAYQRLLGDAAVFAAVEAGRPWREIEAVYTDELAAFIARRERFLIYR